ncbi:hypothetical protein [Rhodococcus sp. IEGM 1379]|uniref:hypothetical protein n=1 Tax=Rhodococcus sp. IEGM 1379 TaxID=3047086 RepID=UPI0024B66A54|nr:hypothetical protein [Rhodococcus sp. IEGM 1379]MDI9914220.1 hypothetical protein [Rhodococcus sp. IEGM 1379]
MAASHYRLGNPVAIVDANGYIGSGPTSEMMGIEPLAARFEAFGWHVVELDGRDVAALVDTFSALPSPSGDRTDMHRRQNSEREGPRAHGGGPRAWHVGCLTPEQRDAAISEITTRMQEATA